MKIKREKKKLFIIAKHMKIKRGLITIRKHLYQTQRDMYSSLGEKVILFFLGKIAPLVPGVGLNYKSLPVVQKVHGGSL